MGSAGINFGKSNEEFIIESDGSGALTSARNAVTGDEYVGGGAEITKFAGTLTVRNSSGAIAYISLALVSPDDDFELFNTAITKDNLYTFDTSKTSKLALIDGVMLIGTFSSIVNITITGGTIEKITNTSPSFSGWRITPTATDGTVALTLLAS